MNGLLLKLIKAQLVLLLFGVINTHAQISSNEVDLIVAEAMQKFDVAGVAVSIVKDGQIIHSKGYGLKSINGKEKINDQTLFAIASNSKAFTTAALAILVEEGKLSWTDKVKMHIPEFKMYNAYVTENFNIQDLLTHRSGLGLGIGDLMLFPDGSDFTISDVISSFQYFEQQSAFRTKFDYDNLLYLVAGEIIERVSGMSWEDFIMKRIFQPLGMHNSYGSFSKIKNHSNLATPHSTETGPIKTISQFPDMINGAAGGIFSNVNDLSKWMLMHLNEGRYGDSLQNKLFSSSSQDEMWKIHTTLTANKNPRYNSHFAGYGLGWQLTDVVGNMSVSHTGGLPGMLSRTVMIPDIELGVVILTNTSNGGGVLFGAVSRTIVDSYLELDDYKWTEKFYNYFQNKNSNADSVSNKVWEVVKRNHGQYINANDYIGIYKDPWFGKVEIFMKEKELWFKSYKSPKLNGPMKYYKANSFAIKWEYQDANADAFAIFSLDEEGKAQSIRMKGISPNIDFSFDFQDLNLQRIQ